MVHPAALHIDPMQPEDWAAVRAIYLEGIRGANATFEIDAPPDWETWSAGKHASCRLVVRDTASGAVIGFSVLSPYSKRHVYRGVAEEMIYIAAAARGQGAGKFLLTALIEAAEAAGFWTLQAGIFPENVASIALHKRCGFREVGYRERIGFHELTGTWRDTVLLERRSKTVGM